MADLTASARPRKWFFVEMFTRDISLSECILDLVDNSIDGLIRKGAVNLDEILFDPNIVLSPEEKNKLPFVKLQYDEKSFKVTDNCGGISSDYAKKEVFNFGHEFNHDFSKDKNLLGVYGIGLKRALFKLGDSFEIASKTIDDGFTVALPSIKDWMRHDTKLTDWSFPFSESTPAKNQTGVGTHIIVQNFSDEVKTALSDGEFQSRLIKEIAKAYALFLERYVRVTVNDTIIEPIDIPFGRSEQVIPANKRLEFNGVKIQLLASVAARTQKNQWIVEQAGWYIACNGRLVVVADKTDLTGWGGGALPQFHSKYRGFVGIALFQSTNPMLLPWKTTKRGLNQESLVFQKVRNHMRLVSRPVLSFLDKMYPTEPTESFNEREIVGKVEQIDIRKLSASAVSNFDVTHKNHRKEKSTVRIQYDTEIDNIDVIRKFIRNPKLTYGEIGRLTFDFYLNHNGLK